jgi:hypothetical protein
MRIQHFLILPDALMNYEASLLRLARADLIDPFFLVEHRLKLLEKPEFNHAFSRESSDDDNLNNNRVYD